MFNRYKFIAPEHHMALQSAVRGRYMSNAQMMANLYQAAQNALAGQIVSNEHLASNCYTTDKGPQVSTATDAKTGVFVQLVKLGTRVLMTTGQKWTMESPVEGTSQTNSVFF